jgi:hypothetical protein
MGNHEAAGIYASAASLVAEQPAADVAPVVRGEWNKPMTDERKAELRGLCERATEGPWIYDDGGLDNHGVFQKVDCDPVCMMGDDGEYNLRKTSKNDALFIAAARTALPELLDDNDAKDREIARLTAELAAEKKRADDSEKCIYDVETYLQMGSAKYIAKTIKEWRGPVAAEGET